MCISAKNIPCKHVIYRTLPVVFFLGPRQLQVLIHCPHNRVENPQNEAPSGLDGLIWIDGLGVWCLYFSEVCITIVYNLCMCS